MSKKKEEILKSIAFFESRLKKINDERDQVIQEIQNLKDSLSNIKEPSLQNSTQLSSINFQSSINKKIALFSSLFKGRSDVYPKMWISKKTGKKGYSPVCENEWINGLCKKGVIKCGECNNRKFSSLTDEVIIRHLKGEIVIGIYPMMEDETCFFLAADFDGQNWQDDALAFLNTCKENNVPAILERSRSGNGGHVWMFFSEPISAVLARQLGSYLITKTMSCRHELNMKSYDRLFTNQDTLPKGGFGNLIALPLQKDALNKGNSAFISDKSIPHKDQWHYLSSVRKINYKEVLEIVDKANGEQNIMGALHNDSDEESSPWKNLYQERLHRKKYPANFHLKSTRF